MSIHDDVKKFAGVLPVRKHRPTIFSSENKCLSPRATIDIKFERTQAILRFVLKNFIWNKRKTRRIFKLSSIYQKKSLYIFCYLQKFFHKFSIRQTLLNIANLLPWKWKKMCTVAEKPVSYQLYLYYVKNLTKWL